MAIRCLVTALIVGTVLADYTTKIQSHIKSLHRDKTSASSSLCTEFSCCNISSTQYCEIKNMPLAQSTVVLPGGDTRCIYSYSSPFAFEVIPGDTDKVLVFLQGGGACWTEGSTKAQFCTSDAVPDGTEGVFNRTDETNAFRDYTVVHVLYCSGDIYMGDVVRNYTDDAGEPVTQKGFTNMRTTLDWLVEQQASGGVAPVLSSLVVMGCSAGSIGVQVWGDQVLRAIKHNKAAVVPDSYVGVFPEDSMGPVYYDFGFCNVAINGFMSDENYKKCVEKTLTLDALTREYIAANPTVPYAFIQSKVDEVQLEYYVAVGLSTHTTAAITPAQFYAGVNDIFETYNKYSNFLAYLVDGSTHCYTPCDRFFTADAISASDNGAQSDQQLMAPWVGAFPLETSATEVTVCEGQEEGKERTTYCSPKIYPKEFVEP